MTGVILSSLFILSVVLLAECKERKIQLTVSGKPVYRNLEYTTDSRPRLDCIPPVDDEKPDLKQLVIYRNGDAVCRGSSPTGTCNLSPASLTFILDKSGNYSCAFLKAPEPPVEHANATIYFTSTMSPISPLDDNNQGVREPRISNDTSLRFVCPAARSNEDGTKVVWKRNGNPVKIEHSQIYALDESTYNLTLKTKAVKTLDGGKYGGVYECERINKNGSVVSSGFVRIPSPPFAASASKSYNKMEGESVTLSCHIDGEPVPTVTWSRKEADKFAAMQTEKRISYSYFEGIPNASMIIDNLVASDYDEYYCTATTPNAGTNYAEVLLRVRSKLAALWPFLGIVAEVIILVAIIFIYERRRAKKEQEETEDAADQKKSLTASNNENKDIRQRKA